MKPKFGIMEVRWQATWRSAFHNFFGLKITLRLCRRLSHFQDPVLPKRKNEWRLPQLVPTKSEGLENSTRATSIPSFLGERDVVVSTIGSTYSVLSKSTWLGLILICPADISTEEVDEGSPEERVCSIIALTWKYDACCWRGCGEMICR